MELLDRLTSDSAFMMIGQLFGGKECYKREEHDLLKKN